MKARISSDDRAIGLHTALSPGACVVATLQPEGEVKLEKMQYLNGSVAEVGENDRMFGPHTIIINLKAHESVPSQTRRHRRALCAAIQLSMYAVQSNRRPPLHLAYKSKHL